ncbi:tRNA threonylcarbamoyl adenosine modification protein TsaE [Syntrophomonas zehnderi OL-4]|uniref:tRNA threonylcarbamoyladenosine biosynthesis protein TsaE n=1 Tax=Syntrophomonas zehnderi OL-4 TaxID=690567 RepID=A0A0E3W3L0_9FIRM|nr:tRNA (adenosine(37)-N6)-threonylcarbamoyltransferase complex ATPase subunit type 1 TsaE [Syntrophomonas zehnderi]CFX90274.1 tRNA threonylcarbamoyl adenosine modification protein TsaE [Syntrophomonas zehnderi OL-4]
MDITIPTEDTMLELGQNLAAVLAVGDIVYLLGNLGVGKTTLVRGIARALGYKGRVTSPTFTLMNIYNSIPPIYHFDFYRLEGGEMQDLGLEDYLEREGISLIEWPRLKEADLPQEALLVEINLQDDDYEKERLVHIWAQGDKYQSKIEGLMKVVYPGHR